MTEIEKKRARRFVFLRQVYELADGDTNEGFNQRDRMIPSLLLILREPPVHELHEAADEACHRPSPKGENCWPTEHDGSDAVRGSSR